MLYQYLPVTARTGGPQSLSLNNPVIRGMVTSHIIHCGLDIQIKVAGMCVFGNYMPVNVLVRSRDIISPAPCLNTKTVFPGMQIPMLKVRQSLDFNMGIPMLARRHLYIETSPCGHFYQHRSYGKLGYK